MKHINFKQTSSQRIYNDYMKRGGQAVSALSKPDREDILMEFNSHIFEAVQNSKTESEVESLLDIIQKLGTPEEVLKPMVADKKLEQATKTFNPFHVFKALALNITNGISYMVFLLLYLALGIGVFLIFSKIFNPSKTGLFVDHGSWAFGTSTSAENEVLGNWFIPCVAFTVIILYVVITMLLRLKKRLNRKPIGLEI